ncbi:hypothetical protein AN396_00295 [Candidatus Epulonipiscium fishelsonii]|uniref:Uncharacterized protein n=1 Tax=Candidatus Epulonipiscium fishelsonii TaxID=77094 RepID=A0ACC8XH29_9FIRM|nr:hypothetical protein AN396_00295 [Epulopiscium sp. SCG-B11WGA-EpuloA1]
MASKKFSSYIVATVVSGGVILSGVTYANTEIKTTTEAIGEFDLSANVYDYGEAIDKINISVDNLVEAGIITPQVDATSLSPDTFKVYSQAFDTKKHIERNITDILVSDDNMDIILLLETKNGQKGQGTLNYDGNVSRNFSIDLVYEVDQVEDFKLISGDIIDEETSYLQSDVVINKEIELFDESSFTDDRNTLKY